MTRARKVSFLRGWRLRCTFLGSKAEKAVCYIRGTQAVTSIGVYQEASIKTADEFWLIFKFFLMVMYFTKNEIYISYVQSFLTNVRVIHKLINIQNTSITLANFLVPFSNQSSAATHPFRATTDLILTTKWTQIHFSYCRWYTNEIVPFVLFRVRPHEEGTPCVREFEGLIHVACSTYHSPASMDEKCILLHKNKPTESLHVFLLMDLLLLAWNYSAYRSYEYSRLQFLWMFYFCWLNI